MGHGASSLNPIQDINHIFEHPPFDRPIDHPYSHPDPIESHFIRHDPFEHYDPWEHTAPPHTPLEPTFHHGHHVPVFMRKPSMKTAIDDHNIPVKHATKPAFDTKAMSYSPVEQDYVDIEKYLWLIFPIAGILIFTFVCRTLRQRRWCRSLPGTASSSGS